MLADWPDWPVLRGRLNHDAAAGHTLCTPSTRVASIEVRPAILTGHQSSQLIPASPDRSRLSAVGDPPSLPNFNE
jgi:hypothetical protein